MPARAAVPSAYDTAEFRRSDGPHGHNAVVAWQAGRTGSGVTIAVLDSGIDPDNPEFAGRISSASRDMYAPSRGLEGPDDHGTSVALIAAAARNSTGVLGIAHGATVLALRTDEPGSCATASGSEENCRFLSSILSQAIGYAVQNGAKVINLSLGGDDGASPSLRSAVANAVNAGSLVVVSSGNDGAAQADAFARELDQAGFGGVLVVGSVSEQGAMSSFSNRAGGNPQHYLAAQGERICCEYRDGQLYTDPQGYIYLLSGTSFSAPQVSGAAALLAQAYPNLTGRQIAQLLLETAYDAGAAGPDPIFGRGILDIARAFRPVGATSLAGGTSLALGDSTGAGSAAMGDSLATASLPAIVLDSYGRAFEAQLAGTLRAAAPASRLASAVGQQARAVGLDLPQASLAFSIDASERTGAAPRLAQLRLPNADAEHARVLAGRVIARLDPKLQVGLAYREGADGLAAQLQGQDRPAFMLAPSAAGDTGALDSPDAALAVRRQVGGWGLTLSAERGEVYAGGTMRRAAELADRRWHGDTASQSVSVDRKFGPVQTALGVTFAQEHDTLLGGRLHDAFGMSGADTLFVDGRAGWDFASGWRLGAALRQGFTRARLGGAVAAGSNLQSRAWALDLTRRGVFASADSLGLRLSQPLRVEGGSLNLSLPSGWDYQSLSARYATQTLSLTPKGRELIGELAWQGGVLGGAGAASLFYRRDPGHHAEVPDDRGMAFRWGRRF